MILNKRIPFQYIFKNIRKDISIATGFSTLVILIREIFPFEFELPIAVPSFLGSAIALVLAFKLNQSYDRWWEARIIWGAIVNDSRSLILQLKQFVKVNGTVSRSKIINRIGHRQIGWCYALSQSLRKLHPIEVVVKPFISNEEYEGLKNHKHIPLALLDETANDIKTLHSNQQINEFQQIQLDDTLVRLCASMGKAERIKNTIFPKTYRIFLRFFVYIFLVCLSIALTDLPVVFELLLMTFIALPFLLLQRTAILIQDPFENRPTDTAMDAISKNIEINIKQLLMFPDVPQIEEPKEFYIL